MAALLIANIFEAIFMKKASLIGFATLVGLPGLALSYPLDDTGFLKSAYCFHMAQAPRLEMDLSAEEKEEGLRFFFSELHSRNLEFPSDTEHDEIQKKYIQWVVPRFRNEPTSEVLKWYKESCLNIAE
ncbi:hypothetical protein [Halomonas heilongjiangensis]|uniref:hypothetical protein n=1 Tax=Halomonas heilongjiangensis TaxID=1387883 RepID=UPI0011AF1C00|nr:hypothetical protein [Halomonas heilongjiangensis]